MSTITKKKTRNSPGRPVGSTNQSPLNMSSAIRSIVEKRNRFMHQREIVKALAKKLGENNIKDIDAFSKKASVLIHSMKVRKSLVQYSASESTRERYYGKSEWIKKGKPKPEYQPK